MERAVAGVHRQRLLPWASAQRPRFYQALDPMLPTGVARRAHIAQHPPRAIRAITLGRDLSKDVTLRAQLRDVTDGAA